MRLYIYYSFPIFGTKKDKNFLGNNVNYNVLSFPIGYGGIQVIYIKRYMLIEDM